MVERESLGSPPRVPIRHPSLLSDKVAVLGMKVESDKHLRMESLTQ